MTKVELAKFMRDKLPWKLRNSKDRDDSVALRGTPIDVCHGVLVRVSCKSFLICSQVILSSISCTKVEGCWKPHVVDKLRASVGPPFVFVGSDDLGL